MGWSADDIPDQTGRTAVITGGNGGIGYHTALALARHGARVLLACRNEARGKAAAERIGAAAPGSRVAYRHLDLADLSTVRAFAAGYDADRLDLLVNNAGVMALPYGRTADGFETQFGVNHLGHFALTGLLLPRLLRTPGARVVTVSSGLHVLATIDPTDPNGERRYRRWVAYARSKSANLLFTHELARRLTAAGAPVTAAAAHPGYADTGLAVAGVRMEGRRTAERVVRAAGRIVAQPAAAGALPTLYAATAPGVAQDAFFGPRIATLRGAPAPSPRAPWTVNDAAGERLWDLSEELTGVRPQLPAVR
ncbi:MULTISPECIES: oxidoreductase [Streptomycetaceae]|uniref:Dehydrogenase n=1 Tax=Streptantibioticus cattleyicolor (strain ATCC 35852 / DSM 46488 / JCM 4925 / NBRC 14057 / NRRL 8057) TaxID=1003195 RepID=F8JNY7_STREN|nr:MULTISPECIES: oxidoreductase [Streptomycetaceae]AEW93928.1 dehydrogenase [Streptantibioticus cattleyicolor NRRL 8057 = DSM 46488]MYS58604.1 SDR family NAD(P)-dependent oxidoreductase [Streptomyces sp. SID5468]CCB74274.1 Retinol dehydrogenase 12 [Streptantibioticus cattleyicolor NRRL 8057 = DSM 46488]